MKRIWRENAKRNRSYSGKIATVKIPLIVHNLKRVLLILTFPHLGWAGGKGRGTSQVSLRGRWFLLLLSFLLSFGSSSSSSSVVIACPGQLNNWHSSLAFSMVRPPLDPLHPTSGSPDIASRLPWLSRVELPRVTCNANAGHNCATPPLPHTSLNSNLFNQSISLSNWRPQGMPYPLTPWRAPEHRWKLALKVAAWGQLQLLSRGTCLHWEKWGRDLYTCRWEYERVGWLKKSEIDEHIERIKRF